MLKNKHKMVLMTIKFPEILMNKYIRLILIQLEILLTDIIQLLPEINLKSVTEYTAQITEYKPL